LSESELARPASNQPASNQPGPNQLGSNQPGPDDAELAQPEPSRSAPTQSELASRLEQELARLRRSGAVPPSLEAALAHELEALRPRVTLGTSVEHQLFAVEASGYIESAPPIASRRPGGAILKRIVRQGVGWYVTFLAQQLNNFHFQLLQLLALEDERLLALEQRLEAVAPGRYLLPRGVGFTGRAEVEREAIDQLAEAVARGPVLVTEAGADGVLAALAERAPEHAFGVVADPERADGLARSGLDVRVSTTAAQLASIADGALAGLVLRGVELELSGSFTKERLLAEALRTVGADGVVLMVHHEPEHLAVEPQLAALAGVFGKPVATGGWAALASAHGARLETRRVDATTRVSTLVR